jgi:hypothetical protein
VCQGRNSKHLSRTNSISKIEVIPISTMLSPTNPGPLGPLPPNGQYTNLADTKPLLQAHARDNGYAIAGDCSTAKKAAWVCSKSGKYNDKSKALDVHQIKRCRNTGTTETGCPFRVRATFEVFYYIRKTELR